MRKLIPNWFTLIGSGTQPLHNCTYTTPLTRCGKPTFAQLYVYDIEDKVQDRVTDLSQEEMTNLKFTSLMGSCKYRMNTMF